jgi:hypothetical protein
MSPTPNQRAQWISEIPDLTSKLNQAGKYLTVPEVSEATGYSPDTIRDLLSREPIDRPQNPQMPLSRPAARIGTTPLYSRQQVNACLKLQVATGDLYLGGSHTPLPKLSAIEADARGYLSVTQIKDLATVHEQTVRKWINRMGDFPPAIALRERGEDAHSGVPFVVRNPRAVALWLVDHGYDVPVPPAPQDELEAEATTAVRTV